MQGAIVKLGLHRDAGAANEAANKGILEKLGTAVFGEKADGPKQATLPTINNTNEETGRQRDGFTFPHGKDPGGAHSCQLFRGVERRSPGKYKSFRDQGAKYQSGNGREGRRGGSKCFYRKRSKTRTRQHSETI